MMWNKCFQTQFKHYNLTERDRTEEYIEYLCKADASFRWTGGLLPTDSSMSSKEHAIKPANWFIHWNHKVLKANLQSINADLIQMKILSNF